MKKTYMKPEQCVVVLQHHCQLLADSVTTNLTGDDIININETPAEDDFQAR